MRILFVSLAVLIIDQATKLYIKGFTIPFMNIRHQGMFIGDSIPVIGDFFKITYIENPGMAFGYHPGESFKLWISIFSLVASVGLFIYLFLIRKQSFSLRLSLAFILGGAVGNLIDRMFYGVIYGYEKIFYGHVVDFFDFDFFNISILGRNYDRFPIFNIADAAVTVGVLILLLFYRHPKEKTDENISEADQQNVKVTDQKEPLAGTESLKEYKNEADLNNRSDENINGKEFQV
ncbi:MAG: signal peptidase II [Ignavibacteriaceae bacterium]|nr:signal peptidase II [Ignavibacteriaceae bacterium]